MARSMTALEALEILSSSYSTYDDPTHGRGVDYNWMRAKDVGAQRHILEALVKQGKVAKRVESRGGGQGNYPKREAFYRFQAPAPLLLMEILVPGESE